MIKRFYGIFGLLLLLSCGNNSTKPTAEKEPLPNIIIIYTDDLGYGDLGVYGGKIPTPNIDKLAKEGLIHTNAYATSATCTPSRYSMLTGEYAWRQKGRGVAQGNASSIIQPGTQTLPSILQKAGYQTAVIGKWHLGLGGEQGPDWNGKITPGPLEIGFNYSFLIPATGDRVPCVFVENHHVVDLDPTDPITVNYSKKIGDWPTGKENPELLTTPYSHGHDMTIVNGVSRIGYMTGGKKALWRDEEFADVLLEKSQHFISKNKNNPFFLYFSTHDIHVPRIAHERFQGATDFGPRGDVIVQLDWTVGALVSHLQALNLDKNTLIIFTSDNGPVLDDGYVDYSTERISNHSPSAGLRGGKYSAFEAGTKVPTIVRWPGKIPSGITSDVLVSQIDFLASFAAYTGQSIHKGQAIDSENHWNTLIGGQDQARQGMVQEAISNVLSYISSDGYKYIPPSKGAKMVPWGPTIETGFSEIEQLYDLKNDPYETKNIASKHPDIVQKLRNTLNQIKQQH